VVVFLVWSIAALMVWIGIRYFTIQWGMRAGLLAVICGLTAYLWIIIGLPGSAYYYQSGSFSKTILLVLLSAGIGVMLNWVWYRYALRK
jgi:hypothetical protein